MNEKELIEQYRKQLANSNDKAPEGLWNDIANDLDIDEVWENITAELDSEERKRSIWINISWAASILVLIGLGFSSLWFLNGKNQNKNLNVASNKLIEDSFENQKKQPQAFTTDNSNTQTLLISKANNNNKINLTHQDVINEKTSDNIQETKPLNRIAPKEATVYSQKTSSTNNISLSIAEVKVETKVEEQSRNNRKFSIGVTYSVKNTWLYGYETINGLNRNSLTKPEVKIYPDIGIGLLYEFSKKWRMESNIFLQSRTGQSYKEYLYGRYSDKDITLYYTQFEMLAKYSSSKHWFNLNTFSLTSSLGFYFSNLSTASETIAGKSRSVYHRYSNRDFGVVFGNSLDITLSNRITLSPGYRVKWGFTNIYAGENNIPSSLNDTHNVSIEFRFTMYYNLFRK